MSLSPERQGRLTASVFASAIGIGYDSRQKLFRTLTGREEPFAGNAATQWGSLNESNAIAAYECMTGNLVDQAGQDQGFIIHPDHDWLGCTPDGFVEIDNRVVVLEAKCPASGNLYGCVPDHYMTQVQGQIAITGSDMAHFAVWTPDEFEVYEVAGSREYWQACYELLEEFWSYVQSDTEPKRKKKPTLPNVDYRRIV